VRIEPDWRALQLEQRLNEQSRADEEDGCERQFRGREAVAQSRTRRAARRTSGQPERRVQIGGGTPRRREPEEQAGEQCHSERVDQHGRVDRHVGNRQQVRRQRAIDHADGPDRARDARGAANRRQHDALDEELPQQPAAARADRRSDGDLLLPCCRAREQQIGDVRASDQQHESDRAEQDEQRGLELRRHECLAERDQPRAPFPYFRELAAQARRDRRHLRLRLRQRHTVAQSADDGDHVVQPDLLLRIDHERCPDVAAGEHGERRGRDADDRVVNPVQRQRSADEPGIAAEPPTPDSFSDHHDVRRTGTVVALGECATGDWDQAEHRHQRRRDRPSGELLRIADTAHREGPEADGGEPKRPGLLLPRQIIESGGGEARDVQRVVFLRHLHQPVRLLEWQRPQQDRVDDGEDGGVRADRERDGENYRSTEDRRAPQRADRISEIVRQHGDMLPRRGSRRVDGEVDPVAEPRVLRALVAKRLRHLAGVFVAKLLWITAEEKPKDPLGRAHRSARLRCQSHRPRVAQQRGQTPGFLDRGLAAEACNPVIPPTDIVGARPSVELFDESVREQTLDRPVERAGSEAELAAGTGLDVLHDGVAVTFTVCDREKDVEGGRRQRTHSHTDYITS
jgi:hypothetical protein